MKFPAFLEYEIPASLVLTAPHCSPLWALLNSMSAQFVFAIFVLILTLSLHLNFEMIVHFMLSNQTLPACYVSYAYYMSFSSHPPKFFRLNDIPSYLISSFFLWPFLHYYRPIFLKHMPYNVPSIMAYQLLYPVNIRGKAAVSFSLRFTLKR